MSKRAPSAAEKAHMAWVASLPWGARFRAKVDHRGPDECWPWQGGCIPGGYGHFWLEGRNRAATHAALLLAGIPRPEGAYALHSCDNPKCVNPAHLRWGTPLDNMQDRSARGRVKSPRGQHHGMSKLSEDEVRAIRTDSRSCREVAKAYGIRDSAVSRIRTGKRWGHLS